MRFIFIPKDNITIHEFIMASFPISLYLVKHFPAGLDAAWFEISRVAVDSS